MALRASSVVENVGVGSLSGRARDAILRAIWDGTFTDGRLPPEGELADLLGVSRTTVRSALITLQHSGLISRKPGRGTFVHPHARPSLLALQRHISFAELLSEAGHKVTIETAWRRTGEPPEDCVKRLPKDGVDFYVMDKLFLADGWPAIFAQDAFSVSVLNRHPDEGDDFPTSILEMSKLYFRESIDHAVVEIVPEALPERLAVPLRLQAGQACIRLDETHYGQSGNALAASVIYVSDRFVRFEVIRRC